MSLDFLDQLAREPNTVVMSCELDLGISDVVDRCWEELQLMRIYTKRCVLQIEPAVSDSIAAASKLDTDSGQKGRGA